MPRRASSIERPSRYGHGRQSAPGRDAAAGRTAAPRAAARRGLGAWAAAALACGPALAGSSAVAADDGVVALSAGPGFGEPAPAFAAPAYGTPAYGASAADAAGEDTILPAGYVTPPAQYGPHGGLSAGPAGPGPGGPAGGVRQVQYSSAPYCPPGGFQSPSGPGGLLGPGGPGGSLPMEYRVKGGLQGKPGSLWTTIARMRPPEGSFVRLEYLVYNVADEENGVIGAPIEEFTDGSPSRLDPLGTPIYSERYDSNYTRTYGTTTGTDFFEPSVLFGANTTNFVVPTLFNNEIEDFDGARVTISQPIKNVGRAEFIAFAFSQETFTLKPDVPIDDDTGFPASVAVPVFRDGDLDAENQVILFRDSDEL